MCPNSNTDDRTMMSESDISSLKDTLYAQQQLLQKLYNELEAEREASATAANEALSVILRLQGEKAAVKMEAEQYKRLSEEKLCHAEESLAIFEDVFFQKDMEVAALDHQVQAYRYKLLSMGCTDHMQRSENLTDCCKCKSVIDERDSCSVSETDSVSRVAEGKTGLVMCDQASCSDKKADDSSPKGDRSYGEQFRKLDFRVKEIAGGNHVTSRSETQSHHSARKESKLDEVDRKRSSESRNGAAVVSCCSTSIHDVFEVPRADEKLDSREREGVVHPEAVKMDDGDEPDWLKKAFKSTHSDINCNLVAVQPRIGASEYQLNQTSEVEEEAEAPTESSSREEEVRLLNEIKEKLDSLHDEIRCLRVGKAFRRDEPSMAVLSEDLCAMLYFWI